MTNEQNALIATKLCGYEVQVSPASKHYIVTDEGTRVLPDWEVDSAETLSTVEALCRSRGWSMEIYRMIFTYKVWVNGFHGYGPTITAAIAHCLIQIAEGE